MVVKFIVSQEEIKQAVLKDMDIKLPAGTVKKASYQWRSSDYGEIYGDIELELEVTL